MNGNTWQWDVVREHAPALATGAAVTLVMAIAAGTLGTVVGLGLGVARGTRRGPWRWMAWPLSIPLPFATAVPTLVLLVLLHHGVPSSTRWLADLVERGVAPLRPHAGDAELAIMDAVASHAFATAVLVLALILAARVTHLVEHGLRRIPAPLIDTARSQGMGPLLRARRVIAPQAFRATAPGLLFAYARVLEHTTLAAFIGANELLHVAWTAGTQTQRFAEFSAVAAAIYLVVLLPVLFVARRLARSRWAARGS